MRWWEHFYCYTVVVGATALISAVWAVEVHEATRVRCDRWVDGQRLVATYETRTEAQCWYVVPHEVWAAKVRRDIKRRKG